MADGQRTVGQEDLIYEAIIVMILSTLSQLNGLNLSHKIITGVAIRPVSGKLTVIDNRKLNSRNLFISKMHLCPIWEVPGKWDHQEKNIDLLTNQVKACCKLQTIPDG